MVVDSLLRPSGALAYIRNPTEGVDKASSRESRPQNYYETHELTPRSSKTIKEKLWLKKTRR